MTEKPSWKILTITTLERAQEVIEERRWPRTGPRAWESLMDAVIVAAGGADSYHHRRYRLACIQLDGARAWVEANIKLAGGRGEVGDYDICQVIYYAMPVRENAT